jgi:hypothetical protein
MPSFTQDKTARQPFGKNAYLRSTQDIKTESATVARTSFPEGRVDGVVRNATLRAITSNIATITTSVAHGYAVGDQVIVNISNAVFDGKRTILATPTSTTFTFERVNADVVSGAATGTIIGGGDVSKVLQPGTVIAKMTSGANIGKFGVFQAGATDGRQTAANIVGVADTFVPWMLLERDVDIAVTYEATVVQAWCFEYNAAGQPIALTNTTRDAMLALPNLSLLFK